MIHEAPHVHTPKVQGASGAHGKFKLRGGTRRGRTGALIAARVHRGDRNVVESACRKPREPEGHSLAGRGARRRRRDLEKGGSGTGRVRDSVVDAIGRQIRQRASVGIRGRRSPGDIEDARSSWGCDQEDSAQEKAEPDEIDGGPRSRKHLWSLPSGETTNVPGGDRHPPSATRLSGLRPDPWLCVPASRRVCHYREGVFPVESVCALGVPT